MYNYQEILVSEEDGIIILTINRPTALNALNDGVFKDLIHFFSLEGLEENKGVIITGSGEKAFAAGADIKEFTTLNEASAKTLSQRGHDIFDQIESTKIPVIAAVNGFSLGGGCELAMACHMRIAGEHAKFGQPEVNLGILPGYGGTQRLPRLIGRGKALELLLTGDMLNANEALALGLVNHVVPSGEEVALAKKIISKIAKKAPLAVAEVIGAVNAYDSDSNGFAFEVNSFGKLATSQDFKEGAQAFIEKRKPEWKRL